MERAHAFYPCGRFPRSCWHKAEEGVEAEDKDVS